MAPIGKNVLTLTNIEQSENFTCVAVPISYWRLLHRVRLQCCGDCHEICDFRYADSNALKKWKVDPLLTSTTIDHLEPFQMYEFVIATVGDFGEGPASIS
ncbi:hypothetical protein OSTOST_16282 [Ostertagia ostertagi]